MLAFFTPGPMEMCIIGIIAVVLFGKRLPSTARDIGRSFVEFKKGLGGVDDIKDDIKNVNKEIRNDIKDVDKKIKDD